jgi:hypothetical protein
MEHLVRAVAVEYGKLGRLTLEADFEQFHKVATGDQAADASGPGRSPAAAAGSA